MLDTVRAEAAFRTRITTLCRSRSQVDVLDVLVRFAANERSHFESGRKKRSVFSLLVRLCLINKKHRGQELTDRRCFVHGTTHGLLNPGATRAALDCLCQDGHRALAYVLSLETNVMPTVRHYPWCWRGV